MAAFEFKLEGVLEQRRSAERQRQGELAAAQRRLLSLQHDLRVATGAASLADMNLRGRVDPRLLLEHARYAQAMRRRTRALREQLADAMRQVSVAQLALTEAAKQRKVLEKLWENQQTAWTVLERRREAMAADDLAQRRD